MWGWLRRYLQRQRELAQGVDADLVADNRWRYKLAFALFGGALLLGLLTASLNLVGITRLFMMTLASILFVAGLLVGRWAAESAFLSKPGPEDPPKIFGK